MTSLRDRLRRVPGLPQIHRTMRVTSAALRSRFLGAYLPGTFYSPLPGEDDIPAAVDRTRREIPGIDLREEAQLALLDELARWHTDLPFRADPQPGLRYHFDNEYYPFCDAVVLFGILRHFRPRRVVEIGSGFSSALMLDTRERFLDPSTHLTFIEPYPERLESLLRAEDRGRCELQVKKVQDVELSLFERLEAGDILFVDSSHVVKLGSDVAWIVFEILPRLARGVILHFHDIPWPFEYPLQWIRAGRAWNEAYFLRAFLQDNHRFRILFFNDFMTAHHAGAMRARLPQSMSASSYPLTLTASSLWIVKE
ncbi:MAG TPA: class I SAM-dependent methyltransferase [Thermoanaerobaculia bacterium]|nr:class I SAM-dependent methyltransferase [Thermoanaerobaculia bacterium]